MSASPRLEAACAQIVKGGIVLLSGDALRGGDIDLVAAASSVTAGQINFMAMHGRGLICLALTPERALHLGISLLNSGSAQQSGRPFGQSIEAREGVDTGISAADRAHTISVAVAETSNSDDIVSPGHVFPLIARSGGVLKRPAAAEAAIDLCRLAGAGEAAVLCSVMREDGSMARIEDMHRFAAQHHIPILDLRDIIGHLEGDPHR